jgi:hypothetical protein
LYEKQDGFVAEILNFLRGSRPIEEGGVVVRNNSSIMEYLKINQAIEVTQKILTTLIDKELLENIFNKFDEQPLYKSYQAWVRSNSIDTFSGSWLRHASFNVDGEGNHNALSNKEFTDNLKLRMGCLIFPDINERKCECNELITFSVNENHLHAISCPKGAPHRSNNHTAITKLLNKFMKDVLISADIVPGECNFTEDELLPTDRRSNNVNIRADTRIYFNGTVRFIDVGVTAPSAKNIKDIAAFLDSAAADTYANKKRNKYKKYLTLESMKYLIPFIIETTGSLGNDAQTFLRVIKNNKHKLITKKDFKYKLKVFRHDQILVCAKNNSRLLQTGYNNQKVANNCFNRIDENIVTQPDAIINNDWDREIEFN